MGDRTSARRILQRARQSSLWAVAPERERMELEASRAFLRWLCGERTIAATKQDVLSALERTNYESLAIASLVPPITYQRSELEIVERVIGELRGRHAENELLPLLLHEAILRQETDRAIDFGLRWADAAPLDPDASGAALHLLVDLAGQPELAAERARIALRRAPGDRRVINNSAYALALAGRLTEARGVLAMARNDPAESVSIYATYALIDLLSSQVDRGIAGFDRARSLAESLGGTRLATLVRLNEALALRLADPSQLAARGVAVPDVFVVPHDYADDASFWLVSQRALREGLRIEVEDL